MGGEKLAHTAAVAGQGETGLFGGLGGKGGFHGSLPLYISVLLKCHLMPHITLTPSVILQLRSIVVECLPCPFFLHTRTTALYASVCLSPRKKVP